MRILDVHGDNAPFFQELAQAQRRVLVVDYDSVIAPCSAPSGVPYPTVTELLDCIMTTSRTRVVVITGGEAAELASPLSESTPDLWGSEASRGPDAMFPGMLSRLEEDTAVAFLSDRDRLFPALPDGACSGGSGAENAAGRQDFVQFLVDWLRVCGGEIC